jgi:hypothetical protein
MKRIAIYIALAVTALTGCGGSDYGNRSPGGGLPATAPLDFSTFVITQYSPASTNETALPVEVEMTNFAFGDQDNPAVFNSLLAVAP